MDEQECEEDLHSPEAADEYIELIKNGQVTVEDHHGNVLFQGKGNCVLSFQQEMAETFLMVLQSMQPESFPWQANPEGWRDNDGDVLVKVA